MNWFKDPKTGDRSVSLTLLVISGVLLAVCGVLQVMGRVNNVGPFSEAFYSTIALYFSRRFNVNGKNFSSEQAEKIEQKVGE